MEAKFRNVCEIHGETDVYFNGECIQCDLDEQEHIKQQKMLRLINDKKIKGNIPQRFFNVSIDSFSCENETSKKIKAIIEEYDFKDNLFLFGKTGTGKTHLAIATLIKFISQGGNGYYSKFYKIPSIQIQDRELYQSILKSKLLILDEFGASATDYKSQLMFEIIDERYDNELPTIFISNKTPNEVKELITDATYSRIKECCKTLTFTGKDYRKSKGEMLNTERKGFLLTSGNFIEGDCK